MHVYDDHRYQCNRVEHTRNDFLLCSDTVISPEADLTNYEIELLQQLSLHDHENYGECVQLREAYAKRTHAAMALLRQNHKERKPAPKRKAAAKRRPGSGVKAPRMRPGKLASKLAAKLTTRSHGGAGAPASTCTTTSPALAASATAAGADDTRPTPSINPRAPDETPEVLQPASPRPHARDATAPAKKYLKLPGNCVDDRTHEVPDGCTLRQYIKATDSVSYWQATLPEKPVKWLDSQGKHTRCRSWEGARAEANSSDEALAMCRDWCNAWGKK